MKWKITLRENRKRCAMFETPPRFDVLVNGEVVSELYFNMRGYTGSIPLPPTEEGKTRAFEMGDCGLSAWRRAVADLNREFAL